MNERVRVGAAQIAPVFFDKTRTLEKTCATIAEAGRMGVDLLVFPETFFAAYPFWRGAVSVRRSVELQVRMQESAIAIPGPETEAIAQAAREAHVNCVIGVNERDDRLGSLTLYNTLLFVSRDGRVLGRHRKLMPTHSERVYWGMGDGRDLRTFAFDVGRVGGLICYEHHMGVLRPVMAALGEEIHAAVWPGWWAVERHLGAKRGEPGARTCEIEPAIREYAVENQVFVVSSSWYLPEDAIPDDLKDVMTYNLAVGGSAIVNPAGIYLAEPVFGRETIVTADITAEERRLAKAYFDAMGHYSRFDVVGINWREDGYTPAGPRPAPRDRSREAARLAALAVRYGVAPERLEAFVEAALGVLEEPTEVSGR
ncbi:MAG: carbon-nitrogen hydrolase family protein [Actinomycetia bacterium]|nr:carbon-nitrogen hydrolase family protein [Actinomycetes bacterium]